MHLWNINNIKNYFAEINMQGKVNTYKKWKANTTIKALCLAKACENWSGQIVRTTFLKCSEKKLFLNFLGNMRGRKTLIQAYSFLSRPLLKKNFIKNIFLFEITLNSYSTRGTTAITYHVYFVVIPRHYK